jgi:Fic-DOC domain mobile mystery protein B
VGLDLTYGPGQTPLEEEEKDGLLLPLSTRQELDEFEQLNIEKAVEWTLKRKFRPEQILTEEFVKQLHRRMFDDVWKWAGCFRKTNKNLGIGHQQIGIALKQLLDDCLFWIENKIFPDEEIAMRFKHRIVSIHCFANGNGRHSRLMGDIIVQHIFRQKVFSWGGGTLHKTGELRSAYLSALRYADGGDIRPLVRFARL